MLPEFSCSSWTPRFQRCSLVPVQDPSFLVWALIILSQAGSSSLSMLVLVKFRGHRWSGVFSNPYTPWYWGQPGSGCGCQDPLQLGFLSVLLVTQQVEAGEGHYGGVSSSTTECRGMQGKIVCYSTTCNLFGSALFLAPLTQLTQEGTWLASCSWNKPLLFPSTPQGGKVFRTLLTLSSVLI